MKRCWRYAGGTGAGRAMCGGTCGERIATSTYPQCARFIGGLSQRERLSVGGAGRLQDRA